MDASCKEYFRQISLEEGLETDLLERLLFFFLESLYGISLAGLASPPELWMDGWMDGWMGLIDLTSLKD